MRLGVFGGSFDPVHYGHLLLAECCREQCQLDCVWLIPAAAAPHKRQQAISPAKARLEMLQLAIAGHDSFLASDLEIRRGGVSYTVDTLEQIRRDEPTATLFILMGADSLADFPNWRDPSRICELAIPIVVRRASASTLDLSVLREFVSEERLTQIRAHQVEMPLVDISSTDLRQRAATGRSLRYRTPRSVEKYIETHGLYRDTASVSSDTSR